MGGPDGTNHGKRIQGPSVRKFDDEEQVNDWHWQQGQETEGWQAKVSICSGPSSQTNGSANMDWFGNGPRT